MPKWLEVMCFILRCFEERRKTKPIHMRALCNLADRSCIALFTTLGINHCHGLRPVSNWSGDFILQPENHGWLPVPLLCCPEPSLSSCSSWILLQAQELLKSAKTMNEDNRLTADTHTHLALWRLDLCAYLLIASALVGSLHELQCLLPYLKPHPRGQKGHTFCLPFPHRSLPRSLMCPASWTHELSLAS